jgi:tRNA G18 (ribose-2'-O)-methylase SpoU
LSRAKEEHIRRRFLQEKFLNAARAKPGRQELRIVLDHLKPDFNVGKIFRSADAFGVHEVLLVGVPWFDPGPAVGSFKHVKARFFGAFSEAYAALSAEGVAVFNLEVEAGPSLVGAELPERCALVLGNEGVGQSFRRADFPGVGALRIPQWGRAQSLNVSVAAALGMYEYCRRWAVDPGPGILHDRNRVKYATPAQSRP